MADKRKIGLREIRALPQNTEIFDAGPGAVPGFGVRRRAGATVSYFVMFRTVEGRQRRLTIGQHGAPWTPDQAREKALAILAEVKIEQRDPAAEKRERREAAIIADLCEMYLADAEAGRLLTRRGTSKKSTTLATDRSRISSHVLPLLGPMKLSSLTRADVERFMHAVAEGRSSKREKTGKPRGLSNVRGGKGSAARTVGMLGALFTYAVRKGLCASNPVTGVIRFADSQRERRLSDQEYAGIGAGLVALAGPAHRADGKEGKQQIWPPALAAIRFLLVTGWRSGEVIGLRWSEVDLVTRTARLADTKTGQSMRPLSQAACAILNAQSRAGAGDLVFPASRGAGVMSGFPSYFARVCAAGGVPSDVTPHVLRHSFASLAADIGFSDATIGQMIGHKGGGITRRYIHHADAVLLAAADRVAEETITRMGR
ncbi:site-specific integrase [Roseomonas sp. 18066]|uniref:tyrosine-type recombinase/integrase n=1 Tax=Roseomonas sp. 18066 TaxID=2681412 RepID=UPI00135894E3|nr:site-specific integrase [Roseomonas sp. 18066]